MRWGSRWRFGRWIPVGCCARCCLWDRMPSLRTALIRSVSGFGKNNTRKQENDLQIAGPLPRLRIFEWPVYLHGSFLCVEWFWERPSQSTGGRGVLSGRTPSVISLCEMPVPLFVAWRRHLPPAGGSLSTQVEALAKRASFVLTGQRQEEACR